MALADDRFLVTWTSEEERIDFVPEFGTIETYFPTFLQGQAFQAGPLATTITQPQLYKADLLVLYMIRDAWPQRPVRIIVGFPAGTGNDYAQAPLPGFAGILHHSCRSSVR